LGGQETTADRCALRHAISTFCFPDFSFSARARVLAAETLKLERTLSDLVKQGKGGKASAKIRLE
jgi:hypothetical protein